MILTELTQPYENPYFPEEDIGLMTSSEFMHFRNPMGKSHEDSVYSTTVASLNRGKRMASADVTHHFFGYRHDTKILYKNNREYPNGYDQEAVHGDGCFILDGKPVAVMLDDVLYYTPYMPLPHGEKSFPYVQSDRNTVTLRIAPKKMVKVKYIDEYYKKLTDETEYRLSYYPVLMKQTKLGDEQITIRTTDPLPYAKNSGKSVVIMNSENKIIATATDEWGATLLRVAEEYKGYGLGKLLGGIWYQLNPSFGSGGLSPAGKQNSISIWADRVRSLLSSGGYSHLVSTGEITKDRVKSIIDGLPEKRKDKKQHTVANGGPAEPLAYIDPDGVVVIYDKKFYESRDPKYVYAHSFLREHMGNVFIFTLDYSDEKWRTMVTYLIFQTAFNLDTKLWMKSPPSDVVDVNLEGIKVDGDFAYLEHSVINLVPMIMNERLYRKKHDPYSEAYYELMEIANSKW